MKNFGILVLLASATLSFALPTENSLQAREPLASRHEVMNLEVRHKKNGGAKAAKVASAGIHVQHVDREIFDTNSRQHRL
jgi:hypothetical protein